MYEHRVIHIPREVLKAEEREYGRLPRYLEEKFDEYSKLGWEFSGMQTVWVEREKGGCLLSLFGARENIAQVLVFRREIPGDEPKEAGP
ncbi:MAG: hypothetical protein ABIV13_00885 [Fimbriimonadales bacterium]